MWRTNDGYTLLEMLICLAIITSISLLSLRNTNLINLDYYYFLNDYLLKQSKAILNKEDVYVDKGLSFNSMGHINISKTLDFNGHKVIIHLGNGYATKN